MQDEEPYDRPSQPANLEGQELKLYRRWQRGLPLTNREQQCLDALSPRQLQSLNEMAALHDEADQAVRHEIREYAHGYPWHRDVGGGLPEDWHDSELRTLRPRDWKQVKSYRFYRVTSRRTPRQRSPRVRTREHRPVASRRASSSSSTSSQDPGDDGDPERNAVLSFLVGTDWSEDQIDAAYAAWELVRS